MYPKRSHMSDEVTLSTVFAFTAKTIEHEYAVAPSWDPSSDIWIFGYPPWIDDGLFESKDVNSRIKAPRLEKRSILILEGNSVLIRRLL